MVMNEDFKPAGSSEITSGKNQPAELKPGERLPKGYGKTKVVLMVVDPYWMHTYWSIESGRLAGLKEMLGEKVFNQSRFAVRVYDVTDIEFNGENANSYFDITVNADASNWFINTGNPDRNYLVEIGVVTPEGRFIMIARSNAVRVPRDTVSAVIDDHWVTVEKDYTRMYQLSGGEQIGKSSFDVKEMIARRFQEELSSGSVSSFGSGSVTGNQPREASADSFWLRVETELIVYGATEPDAALKVQGIPVKLRPDGTFTLRFALPDGSQVIPVEADSADGKHHRCITPIVQKKTE